jgi:hypothetical protein
VCTILIQVDGRAVVLVRSIPEMPHHFSLPLENATLRMTDKLYNPIVMQYSHYVQLVQKKKIRSHHATPYVRTPDGSIHRLYASNSWAKIALLAHGLMVPATRLHLVICFRCPLWLLACSLSVRCVGAGDRGQLRLPLVAVREQLLLVVEELLPCLHGVLGVGALHDGVHGARLLAEAAVDALGHVNVVAGRAARAVSALFGFDGDGLRRANGLAQLASDAALFASRVAAQSVLTTEAGRDRALLEWVEDCVAEIWVSGYSNGSALAPQGVCGTYGGLKNCSSTTYMPRNISVKRK